MKTLTLLLLLISFTNLSGQINYSFKKDETGKVYFEEIIEIENSKATDLYIKGKEWFSMEKMWNELESYFEKKYIFTDISMEFESELHDFFNDEKEYTPNTKGKMIKMLKCIIHDFIELEYETIYKAKKTGIETVLSEIDLLYIEKQLDRIIKPNSKPVNIALDENEL